MKNIFLNRYLISWNFNYEFETIVYDTARKTAYYIWYDLQYDLWIDTILNFLLWYKYNLWTYFKNLRLSYNKIKKTDYKNIVINNLYDLYKNSFKVDYKSYDDLVYCKVDFSPFLFYLKNNCLNEPIQNWSWWVDFNKKVAYEKAISEMVERVSLSYDNINNDIYVESLFSWKKKKVNKYKVFYGFLSSSNWAACHFTKQQAINNWLIELIERDVFLLVWFLKKWIYKINIKSLNLWWKISKLVDIFQENHLTVQLFLLKIDNPVPVILTYIKNANWYGVFSLSWWFSLQKAIEKSLLEWIMLIDLFKNIDLQNIRNYIFNNKRKMEPMFNLMFYLLPENRNKIKWIDKVSYITDDDLKEYVEEKKYEDVINYYHKRWIDFYYYLLENNITKAFNRKVIKVISDELLQIYFWPILPLDILSSRRLKYRQRKFNIKKLNLNMHPFW